MIPRMYIRRDKQKNLRRAGLRRESKDARPTGIRDICGTYRFVDGSTGTQCAFRIRVQTISECPRAMLQGLERSTVGKRHSRVVSVVKSTSREQT